MKWIILLLLLIPFLAAGQGYYYYYGQGSIYQSYQTKYPTAKWVDNTFTGTSTGSFNAPYKTIIDGITGVSVNGVVLIKQGTYTETTNVTSKAGISIIGIGSVIVKNATESGGASSQVIYVSSNNVTIKYITFNGIFANGTTLRYSALHTTGSNTTLVGCTFKNTSTVAAYTLGGTGFSLSNCMFTSNTGKSITADKSIIVDGCTIASDVTYASYPIQVSGSGSNITITNCRNLTTKALVYSTGTGNVVVTGNYSTGALVYCSATAGSVLINGNTIAASTSTTLAWLIYFAATCNASSITIDGNTLIHSNATVPATTYMIRLDDQALVTISNNTIETYSTTAHDLIRVQTTSRAITQVAVKNNILKYRTSAHGLKVGSETSTAYDDLITGVNIENNKVYGPAYYSGSYGAGSDHGLFVGHNIDATIRYNTVIGSCRGIVYKDYGSTTTIGAIYNNVLIDCSSGIAFQDIKGLQIYGNTILNYRSDGWINDANHQVGGIKILADHSDCEGLILKNNVVAIIGSNWVGKNNVYPVNSYLNAPDFVSDYNCYYNEGANLIDAGCTWATWQGLGFDLHGINSAPLFYSSANYQLWPTAESPLLDAGEDLGSPYDYLLLSTNAALSDALKVQQGGNWNMGAYSP